MNLIGVKNLEESKSFYENALGMKFLEFRPPFSEAILDEKYLFNIEEDAEYRSSDWAHEHIGGIKSCVFETDTINEFLEVVKKYGGNLVTEPQKEPWGYIVAKFSDPSGNIFIVEQEDK